MTNCREFPKTFIRNKELIKGESEIFFSSTVEASVWQDKCLIYFVTSADVLSSPEYIQRYDAMSIVELRSLIKKQ